MSRFLLTKHKGQIMNTKLSIIALLCATTIAQADVLNFSIMSGQDSRIEFESHAPLETIIGSTDQVSGYIKIDPNDLNSGITASVIVEAASLNTGNKKRDTHMRNNHLHTDDHPQITFTIDNLVLEGSLSPGSTYTFNIDGGFNLHGVTRTITIPVEVTYEEAADGKKLHIKAQFEVKLSDYEIPRPQFLIMKLDEIQKVTVDVRGIVK
ncbi:hypothetical protein CEE37_04870 [candidate division LCP-89 bacterium B3_LCP]|uniref:Lipid/polyisoprenoid-binding YceI-like domain-containing protein n=1 Tax=candidate division LCP-89 bacterium B3_LCP TaxID=2012998 RepID=A0A532V1A8_UNCL8|nr:MAG: hypothetical protein CEE37_04870 [candidate division LCP-89 bacterium B3_LCP]